MWFCAIVIAVVAVIVRIGRSFRDCGFGSGNDKYRREGIKHCHNHAVFADMVNKTVSINLPGFKVMVNAVETTVQSVAVDAAKEMAKQVWGEGSESSVELLASANIDIPEGIKHCHNHAVFADMRRKAIPYAVLIVHYNFPENRRIIFVTIIF